MLDNDEKECTLLAINYFLQADEESMLCNNWTSDILWKLKGRLEKELNSA